MKTLEEFNEALKALDPESIQFSEPTLPPGTYLIYTANGDEDIIITPLEDVIRIYDDENGINLVMGDDRDVLNKWQFRSLTIITIK